MIKFTLLFLVSAVLLLQSSAQSVTITGSVMDTSEKRTLTNAVVALIHKGDSTLVNFDRSDKNGAFRIRNVTPGKYSLLVTFPKFADYSDDIEVKDQSVFDIGVIPLTLKSLLLKEVVVHANQAIRIKGDTTEFTADSFKVREGATVEELLKKMPGFQVNSKGEITAQGKKVDKVLVDGEEFFGDDPTMATQNISAKAVDKVQVYDTKSEQEQLKGITSGGEGKTVNIKLKDDMKRGAFGKVEAGTNFNDIADAKLLYNNFVGKKKISLYGTKSNTSTGSLGWEDQQKLGMLNMDMEYDEINGYYFMIGSSEGDEFNNWMLRGLPNAYAAGGLYINKWNEDKQAINGSYSYNRLGVVNETNIRTQNILPDTLYYTNQKTNTNSLVQQHALNIKYEWKIDSLASIKYTGAGIYKTSHAYNTTYTESLNEDSLFVNNSNRINAIDKTRRKTDHALTYKQLFHKQGRQLIATARLGVIDDEQTNMLSALTRYYEDGYLNHSDSIDQKKTINGHSVTSGLKVTYSEPLSTKWNLILESSYNQNNSTSRRNTFDKDFNGKYESFNPLYSNNFKVNASSGTGTVFMKYSYKKWKAAFGSGLSAIQLKLFNLDSNKTNTYHFLNLTPQAQAAYSFKTNTQLSIRYRGNTVQPTIDQLQPIRDNSDPLNVFVGNPNLKVGFNHNMGINYNSFKPLSGTYMYVGTNLTIIENAITYANSVDPFGKRTYTPVNVNGNQNWNIYSGWRHGQGEKKLLYGANVSANGGKNIQFINGRQGTTNYGTYEFSVFTGYNINEKFNLEIRPQIGYTISHSSLRPDVNTDFFTYGGSGEGFVLLPGKLELNTDVNLNLREKTVAFNSNINIITWNASLGKKIFKKKDGKISFVVNDILNQNKGINRTINSNFISEETYLRRSRYFMLRFEWTFNKMPGTSK